MEFSSILTIFLLPILDIHILIDEHTKPNQNCTYLYLFSEHIRSFKPIAIAIAPEALSLSLTLYFSFV